MKKSVFFLLLACCSLSMAQTTPQPVGVLDSPHAWIALQNFSAGATASTLNGMINAASCGLSAKPSWCSGSDIGAWVNAAVTQCGHQCTILIPSGAYSAATTIQLPITSSSTLNLVCDGGAIITFTGSGYWVSTHETGTDPAGSKLKIQGCHVTGSPSSQGGVFLNPSAGAEIYGNILTYFSAGDGVTLAGANSASVHGNLLSYDLNGIRLLPTHCAKKRPFACSPTTSGAGYSPNANHIYDNAIESNSGWGYLDDRTQGYRTPELDNLITSNDLEANGRSANSTGAILLTQSISTKIERNYFEGNPRNIVVGNGTATPVGTQVNENYFTVSARTPYTVELVTAARTNILGNTEFGRGSTCFLNQTTGLGAVIVGNQISSANPVCVNHVAGLASRDFYEDYQGDVVTTGNVTAADFEGTIGAKSPAAVKGTTGNFSGAVSVASVNGASILSGTTGTITGTSLSASCDSGTVRVTGAAVGHPVSVSSTTGEDVGGAFNLKASVTATNTVTVYICGTGTPASLAYNVTVF